MYLLAPASYGKKGQSGFRYTEIYGDITAAFQAQDDMVEVKMILCYYDNIQ